MTFPLQIFLLFYKNRFFCYDEAKISKGACFMYSIQTVKKLFLLFIICFILWFICAAADLLRVNSFEMPIFARPTVTADDGGSGTYKGLGWRIELEGNFLPEDELPGVTKFEYYLGDDLILASIRD